AKYPHRRIGNCATLVCRSRNSSQFENSFFPSAVNSMTALGENMKKWLSLN
ncbi:dihydrodipicolinate synthase family protein, partial [Klebsiella oxytoca]